MSLHPRPPAALLRAPPRRLGSTAFSSSSPRGSCSGPSRSRCAASCLSSAARRRCGIPRWCSSSRRCPSAHILLAILPSLPAPDRTISTAISTAKCPRSHRPRIRQQPCHRPCQYSPINADRPLFRLSVERIAALEAIGDERAKALEAGKAGALDAKSAGERSPGWTVQTARKPKGVNRDMAFEFRAGGTAGTGVRNARMAARLGALQLIGSALFPMAVANVTRSLKELNYRRDNKLVSVQAFEYRTPCDPDDAWRGSDSRWRHGVRLSRSAAMGLSLTHLCDRVGSIIERLAPRASRLAPRASRLAPRASRLAPRASRLAPRASRLAPRASRLAPRASRLSHDCVSGAGASLPVIAARPRRRPPLPI